MTIRTLERDIKYLKDMNLKTVDVLERLYEKIVQELRSEQIAHKNKMKYKLYNNCKGWSYES